MPDLENEITKLYVDLAEITDEMLLARMKVKAIRLEKLKLQFKNLISKFEDLEEYEFENLEKQEEESDNSIKSN